MGISTVRVSSTLLEEFIFNGKTDSPVKIQDIKKGSNDAFILTIEGLDIPDCDRVEAIFYSKRPIHMKFEKAK